MLVAEKEEEKMKAYYEYSSRSDKVLAEHLDLIELIPYEEATIVICIGDRPEIMELCYKAFIDHKYIIHYYAGVINKYITCYDDIFRHCITLMSNEQWVESKQCAKNVRKICKLFNKAENIKIIGSNHFPTTIPEEPYNLVLYNPCTTIKEIFIGPNPDISYANVTQEELHLLIRECKKFYTNSSCGVYEAPFLIKNKQIVWLGKRNKKRRYKN